MPTKSEQLRQMLRDGVVRCIGAHDGLSARLAARAGADALWASGLEISTAHALPDASILTMTDFLQAATVMNDAVDIPVVADCDTGYGNVNNVIHLVRKYENAGIAAVCIEDKHFPKLNSFVPGRQKLAAIAEFVGKIRAAKATQRTDSFMVFARVEALIAGWGHAEAMRRAHAYAHAGADAILIHSKKSDPSEIVEFVDAWDVDVPLILVPTTYPDLDLPAIEAMQKVKLVIYANHGLRAAIRAMSETFGEILETGGTRSVEPKLVKLKDVFELQGMPDVKAAEAEFGYSKQAVKVVIPAAGVPADAGLREMLDGRPVATLDINGKPLLQRQVELLNSTGLMDIRVVIDEPSAAQADAQQGQAPASSPALGIRDIAIQGVTVVAKSDPASYILGSVASGLAGVEFKPGERLLVVYSDILFEKSILERLIDRQSDVTLVVDRAPRQQDRVVDLVEADLFPLPSGRWLTPENKVVIRHIGAAVANEVATHEFVGMALFSSSAVEQLLEVAAEVSPQADMTVGLERLMSRGVAIEALEIERGWSELHSTGDVRRVCQLLANG